MTKHRRPRGLMALANQLTLALMALATLAAIVALIMGAGYWLDRVYVLVYLVLVTLNVFLGRRASRDHYEMGKWDERTRLADSMVEAQARGMDADDWLQGYSDLLRSEGPPR